MKVQLHEAQIQMSSSLTSGVFCVGSNIPAGQQTAEREKTHQKMNVLTQDHNEFKRQPCSYRPCLLLRSFSRIHPFFADLSFMFLKRDLQTDKTWPMSLFSNAPCFRLTASRTLPLTQHVSSTYILCATRRISLNIAL